MKQLGKAKQMAGGGLLGTLILCATIGCGTTHSNFAGKNKETPIATNRTVASFKPNPAELPVWKKDGNLTIKPIIPLKRDDTPAVVIKPLKKTQ